LKGGRVTTKKKGKLQRRSTIKDKDAPEAVIVLRRLAGYHNTQRCQAKTAEVKRRNYVD